MKAIISVSTGLGLSLGLGACYVGVEEGEAPRFAQIEHQVVDGEKLLVAYDEHGEAISTHALRVEGDVTTRRFELYGESAAILHAVHDAATEELVLEVETPTQTVSWRGPVTETPPPALTMILAPLRPWDEAWLDVIAQTEHAVFFDSDAPNMVGHADEQRGPAPGDPDFRDAEEDACWDVCKQATADICKPAGGWGGIYCKVASVFVCGELCYDDPDGWFCDWYDTCQICCQAAYGCESYCPAADFTAY